MFLRCCMFFLAFVLATTQTQAAPEGLRCDGSLEPAGIDTPRPQLSWMLKADEPLARGITQSAYQILVASSPDRLQSPGADLWDSQQVTANAMSEISYAGKPLSAGQQVFWKVRVWTAGDQPGPQPSAWSPVATWTMGLLSPDDWKPAKWISGHFADTSVSIGYHALPTPDPQESKWVQIDLGSAHKIDSVQLFPMSHVGISGFAFPIRYMVQASVDPTFEHAITLSDRTTEDVPNPGITPVNIAAATSARYVRVTATKLVHRNNGYCFALSELAVLSEGHNIAQRAAVTAKDSVEDFGWSAAGLTDGNTSGDTGDNRKPFGSMLLRRDVEVKSGLKHAVLFVTGLGQYEVSINGKKLGDQLLAPGWTNYRKTVLYDTFDVTSQLRSGNNAMGIILGNGMYNIEPTPGRYVKFTQRFGPLKAIARLQLEFTDGSTEAISSDRQWHVSPGPITYSNIFGGEDFDARAQQLGWDQPGFSSNASWESAIEVDGPGGTLRGHSVAAPAIQAIESHAPLHSNSLKPGVTVYDLGQNASHMPRLQIHGPRGSSVRVIPSELLGKDGYVDRASCVQDAGGPAWWQYTLSGEGDESYFPKFFYQGCRYLQVECLPASPGGPLPTLLSIEGVVVHSAAQPIGSFECSNELFNKTYSLVRWAQRSNMMSLMTDCPHREKLGWLEELHLNGPSLRYNFRMDNLYNKEMNDMADSQQANGFVPNIAPEYFLAHTNRLDDAFRNSPEWGSSMVIVPWQQYVMTGDVTLLREHYSQMVRYVDFLKGSAKQNILTTGLGDWYDIGPKPPWGSQLTPPPYTATAIFYYDTVILSRAAEILGDRAQAIEFQERAGQIRKSFNAKFFNAQTGSYATGSQCANAMALALNLAEPESCPAVLSALIADIRSHGNALTAGDVGYRFVLRALADAGRSDVVFDMNNQSDRPGYGMQIKRGATSLTEKWDASVGQFGSQNHFMLGQINEWLFHDLAGIQPDEKQPGFTHIIIKPAPVGDITWLRASYQSNRGPIDVQWKRVSTHFQLQFTIPPGTTATVYLPSVDSTKVTEGDGPASLAKGVKPLERQNNLAIFAVGSGHYEFQSEMGPAR